MAKASEIAQIRPRRAAVRRSPPAHKTGRARQRVRVYEDPSGALTSDESWAVSLQWVHSGASPAAMCQAYEAVLSCRDWTTAADAARSAGAHPAEAALLADRLSVALSPNRTRHAWVLAVSDAVPSGPVGSEAAEWLIDADLTVDARLGARIAAEAAVRALSAMEPPAALEAGRTLMLSLHAATLPDPALTLRCVAGVGAFVHRRRCYLMSPAPLAAVSRVTAAHAAAAAVLRRSGGMWHGTVDAGGWQRLTASSSRDPG